MRGGDMRTDMSLMSFRGRTNSVLELGKRLLQHDEEWKDKCAALHGLSELLVDFAERHIKDAGGAEEALFAPENVQALTQPFRATLLDLRSAVVKVACTTLSQLAETLGPVRSKLLVRDLFPTLLDARGTANKVNTNCINECIEAIVKVIHSRFVLAPILQVLDTSKNREVRESGIYYTYLALDKWNRGVLERFKLPLQAAIVKMLSDASPKGRETARECYCKYVLLWPEERQKMDARLSGGVKKHLKRSRKEAGIVTPVPSAKRRHLATITNVVGSSVAKTLHFGGVATHEKRYLKRPTRLSVLKQNVAAKSSRRQTSTDRRSVSSTPASVTGSEGLATPMSAQSGPASPSSTSPQKSQVQRTPTSDVRKPREGYTPSKIPSPVSSTNSLPARTTLLSHEPRRSPEEQRATPTHLEQDHRQLEMENASLLVKIEAHVQEQQRLRERLQMQEEDRSSAEARECQALSSMVSEHAEGRSVEQEAQRQIAERLAAQEVELAVVHQSHAAALAALDEQKAAFERQTTALQAQIDELTTEKAETAHELTALRSENASLQERLSAFEAQGVQKDNRSDAPAVLAPKPRNSFGGRLSLLESKLSSLRQQLAESSKVAAVSGTNATNSAEQPVETGEVTKCL